MLFQILWASDPFNTKHHNNTLHRVDNLQLNNVNENYFYNKILDCCKMWTNVNGSKNCSKKKHEGDIAEEVGGEIQISGTQSNSSTLTI